MHIAYRWCRDSTCRSTNRCSGCHTVDSTGFHTNPVWLSPGCLGFASAWTIHQERSAFRAQCPVPCGPYLDSSIGLFLRRLSPLPVFSSVKFLSVSYTILCTQISAASSDHGFQLLCPPNKLACMAQQRFNLYVNHIRDIDEVIHNWRSHDINFCYFVGQQTLFQQFWKIPGVLRHGVNSRQGCHTGCQVICMVATEKVCRHPASFGRRADNTGGPVLAEESHQVSPQLNCWLQQTIGVVEEKDILQAERSSSRALLALPGLRDLASCFRSDIGSIIRTAARCIGTDDVVGIPFIAHPGSNGSGCAELRIVRMGHNHHRNFILLVFLFAHNCSSFL